jgi:hypothetical protein
MLRTVTLAVTVILAIVTSPSCPLAADDATGRLLQQSMIWLDSAPFSKEVYAAWPCATAPSGGSVTPSTTLHFYLANRNDGKAINGSKF